MTEMTTPEIDFDALIDALHQAIEQADAPTALQALITAGADDDTARLIDRLSADDRQALFGLLTPEQGAEVLERVYYFQGADIIEELSAVVAAPFIAELDSDDRADLMNELDEKDSKAILEELDDDMAHETRRFMAYPDGTAGAIMYSEYVSFSADMTVEDILNDIQSKREKYIEYGVQYAYVLDADQKLLGVLPVRNLLFARREQKATEIMIPDPTKVRPYDTVLDLESIFDEHNYLGLPVVNKDGQLIGIIDRESTTEALQEAATEDLLKFQGLMGKEELRSMPLKVRSGRRLSWLSSVWTESRECSKNGS